MPFFVNCRSRRVNDSSCQIGSSTGGPKVTSRVANHRTRRVSDSRSFSERKHYGNSECSLLRLCERSFFELRSLIKFRDFIQKSAKVMLRLTSFAICCPIDSNSVKTLSSFLSALKCVHSLRTFVRQVTVKNPASARLLVSLRKWSEVIGIFTSLVFLH